MRLPGLRCRIGLRRPRIGQPDLGLRAEAAPLDLRLPRRASRSATTFIWFSVSVPVLSVQMNVVAPRVSTDSSRRTSAFCPAIRWAPIASDRVTVGSSPSGTSATVTPIPKMNPSEAGTPRASIRAKNTTPTAPAMIAIIRTRCADVALQWRGRARLLGEPGDAAEPGRRPGGTRRAR